jgi:hypothetical protein
MLATLAELKRMAAVPGVNQERLALISRRLEAAIAAYEQSTTFVLTQAQNALRSVFFGSVPYLMLSGVVVAGWQMARAALACCRYMDKGDTDPFYGQKLSTCVFYAAQILPRAESLCAGILEGEVVNVYTPESI